MRNRIFCFSSHFFQFSRFGFRYLGSPLAKPSRACAFSSHREKVADTGNIGTFSLRCTSRESPRALRVAHLAQTEDAMPVPNYRIRGRPESGNATFQPNPRAPGQTRRSALLVTRPQDSMGAQPLAPIKATRRVPRGNYPPQSSSRATPARTIQSSRLSS